MDSSAYRNSLRDELQKQRTMAEALLKGQSSEQLLWKPNDDTWCVAQIVEHMRNLNDKYLIGVSEVIRERRHKETTPQEYSPNGIGRRVIQAVGPDGNANLPVPKKFRPQMDSLPRDVTTLFLDQLAAVDEIINESVGVNLRKSKVSSPVSRMLRFQLGDVFKIILVHNDRHLRQVDRLMRLSGYPMANVETAERVTTT